MSHMNAATCPQCGFQIPQGMDHCPICNTPVATVPQGRGQNPNRPPEPAYMNPVYMQYAPQYVPPLHGMPVPYIARYRRTQKEKNRRLVGTIGAFAALTLVFSLVISLIYLLWSPSIVIPNGMSYGARLFILSPTSPHVVPFITLTGWAFTAYYLFLVAVISISFFYVVFRDWKLYSRELNMTWKPGEHSTLFEVAGIFFAVFFFDIVYMIVIVGLFQAQPSSPDFSSAPVWRIMYSLANASVWEELITRVLLVGVPLLAYHSLTRRKKYPIARYFIGGGIEMDNAAIVLVVISSVMFGLGHLDNWDIYKVFPTAVAGIAFAYVFLKYGLAGSVILHFSFDFMTVPGQFSGTFLGLQVAFMLIWFLAGIIFFFYYLNRLVRFVDSKLGLTSPIMHHPAPDSAASIPQGVYIPPAQQPVQQPQYYAPQPPVYPAYAPYQPPYNTYNYYYNPYQHPYQPPQPQAPPPVYPQQAYYPPYPPQQYHQYPPQPPAPPAYQPAPVQQPAAQQQSAPPQHPYNPPYPEPGVQQGNAAPQKVIMASEQGRKPHQGHGFVCPSCGYTEARYENGSLVCLRCGTVTRL